MCIRDRFEISGYGFSCLRISGTSAGAYHRVSGLATGCQYWRTVGDADRHLFDHGSTRGVSVPRCNAEHTHALLRFNDRPNAGGYYFWAGAPTRPEVCPPRYVGWICVWVGIFADRKNYGVGSDSHKCELDLGSLTIVSMKHELSWADWMFRWRCAVVNNSLMRAEHHLRF